MTDHELFVQLSYELTGLGDKELPAMEEQRDANGAPVKLYEIYFDRLKAAYEREFLALLKLRRTLDGAADVSAALHQELGKPEAGELRVAARQVIKIWYLSTMDDPKAPLKDARSERQLAGDLGQYQLSAVWDVIKAHVPAYSNLPHGYWAEAPR